MFDCGSLATPHDGVTKFSAIDCAFRSDTHFVYWQAGILANKVSSVVSDLDVLEDGLQHSPGGRLRLSSDSSFKCNDYIIGNGLQCEDIKIFRDVFDDGVVHVVLDGIPADDRRQASHKLCELTGPPKASGPFVRFEMQ